MTVFAQTVGFSTFSNRSLSQLEACRSAACTCGTGAPHSMAPRIGRLAPSSAPPLFFKPPYPSPLSFSSPGYPSGIRAHRQTGSTDELPHNLTVDVGQPVIPTLEFVGQAPVVDSQQVENRRIEVVYVDGIACDVIAKLVGLAIRCACSHASARHPNSKAAGMVIAAVVGLGQRILAVDRTAEFASPNHERFVQQSSLLKVLNEGSGCLIGILALDWQLFRQIMVLVPPAMKQLNKPHAMFDQAPGKQAV